MTYTLRTQDFDRRIGWRRHRLDLAAAYGVMHWMASFADDEYVNEDCPAECSTAHEWPHFGTRTRRRWNYNTHRNEESGTEQEDIPSCPETGMHFEWCDLCDEWQERRWSTGGYSDNSRIPGVGSVCDPSEHGYFHCDGCEEYVDDDRYSCDGYCDRCYDGDDEDGGAYGRGHVDGESLTTARCCDTQTLHVHALTEEYLCDCRAMTAHLAGLPVEFHGDGAQSKFLKMFGVAA